MHHSQNGQNISSTMAIFFFLGTNMTIQASTRIIKPKHATEHILLYYKQGAFIPGQLAIGQ